MAKLFITLYLMVIASFLVFGFYLVTIDSIGDSFGDGSTISERVSIGTFKLLDASIDGLDPEERKVLLEKYKEVFNADLKLAEISTFDLEESEISKLNDGHVISKEEVSLQYSTEGSPDFDEDDDFEMLYYKRLGTSLVWRAHLDYEMDLSILDDKALAINIEGNTFAEGMMHLMQLKLLSKNEADWPTILRDLEPEFGLPINIIDYGELDSKVLADEQLRIKDNRVANISQGTMYATLVRKIPNSNKLLQVGPVKVPWNIRNYPYILLASFILAFATTLLLWLWPFWTNLMRIKKAANQFGDGNYNARVISHWWSPISKISNAFNAMAEQTQNSIRQQKELTSAVSHELRTPVARMRFALEMLDSSDKKNDKTRYIKDINEDIDELDLLLEELLTYARFDQKSYSINPSLEKLIPWLSDSMEKLMPLAEGKTLHYRIEGIGINETSLFEARLMTRVLDNLVQNALRYANHNIEVILCKDHDNYLLIVEDDGEGISQEKRKHVFDAFSRIDASRDRASGGFGLGLAIVDRIIKAHLGNVTVHDSKLGGARFEVRIPVKTNY